MTDLALSICSRDPCVIVGIYGECDAANAGALREVLLDVLTGESARMVLLLARLDFLDCAGARTLKAIGRRARLLDGALALAAPSPPVYRLLRLTGLDGSLAIFPAVDDALTAVHSGDAVTRPRVRPEMPTADCGDRSAEAANGCFPSRPVTRHRLPDNCKAATDPVVRRVAAP